MPLNPLFPRGTSSEQDLAESLIIESIQAYGKDFYYIPRTLVAKDDILGEDNLSEFKHSYPIEGYFANVDNFGGAGQFMSKFGGLTIEESATLIIARKRWNDLVGVQGTTILPNRPAEGDLLYFPLNDGIFEIRFVQHQNPFYQLGRLYVYALKIELFQFNSETFETGVAAVDTSALEKSFDILAQRVINEDGTAIDEEDGTPTILEPVTPPDRDYGRNSEFTKEIKDVLDWSESNPLGDFLE